MPNIINQQRRKTLQLLASLAASLPILAKRVWGTETQDDAPFKESRLMTEFILLSQLLTTHHALDIDTATHILQKIQTEPWGKEHLHRVWKKLVSDSKHQPFSQAMLNTLDQGELWFTGHLLTTWVTGSYFHQSGNEVISYKHALMHESLRDLYPEPNLCNQDFGYWQNPPKLT